MNILYRSAQEKDMTSIAALHTRCFQGYFLTDLGEKLLSKYYQEFFSENPDLFILANDEDNGRLVGFVMGYLKGSQARKNFERNNRAKLTLRMLCMCATFKTEAWKRVLRKLKSIAPPPQKTR
jgi:ribosomal protein S18 acetylase RimI-like enzyme